MCPDVSAQHAIQMMWCALEQAALLVFPVSDVVAVLIVLSSSHLHAERAVCAGANGTACCSLRLHTVEFQVLQTTLRDIFLPIMA